jgi:hypothetical protein
MANFCPKQLSRDFRLHVGGNTTLEMMAQHKKVENPVGTPTNKTCTNLAEHLEAAEPHSRQRFF